MLQNFTKWGIAFQTIEYDMIVDSPEKLLPYYIQLILPEIDNRRRSLNTQRGMRQAMREGRCVGTAPYGYKLNKANKLAEIDQPKAQIVYYVFTTFAEGVYSAEEERRMAREKGLNRTKTAFLSLLSNQFYTGKIVIKAWDKEPEEVVQGLHKPIISERLFERVQIVLKGRKKGYKGLTRKGDIYLTGQLICPKCGLKMTGSASKGNGGYYHYYHCQRKYGCKNSFQAKEANNNIIKYLEELQPTKEVIELYGHILKDVFISSEAQKVEEQRRIEKEISQVDKRIESLEYKFLDDNISQESYNSLFKILKGQLNELHGKRIALTTLSQDYDKYVSFGLTLMSNLSGFYEKASMLIRKKILGSIFPENLIYENKKYRTTKMNEFFALICKPDKGSIKTKPNKNAGLFSKAPPSGLEPETL